MNGNFGIFGNDLNKYYMAQLEKEPEYAYFGQQNQWKTPNMRRYFQGQYSNIQNQYMGQLGQQVLGGGAPDMKFTDFLSRFPFQQQFQESGAGRQETSRFNPFTRWST